MRHQLISALTVTLALLVTPSLSAATMDDHIAALRARALALQNVTVTYEQTAVYTPSEKTMAMIEAIRAKRGEQGNSTTYIGTYVTQEVFRRNGPNLRVTTTGVSGPARAPGVTAVYPRTDWSRVGDKTEMLLVQQNGHVTTAWSGSTTDNVMHAALGIGDSAKEAAIDPVNEIIPGNLQGLQDGKVELTRTINGGFRFVWTFDPAQDYAIVRHRLERGDTSVVHGDMQMSDFKKVDGVALPTTVVEEGIHWEDGQRLVTRKRSLKVTEYKLNDKANTEDGLRIEVPKP